MHLVRCRTAPVMKPPSLPFVFVQWDDAWKSATDETTLENAGDDHKPIVCVSSGFVLRDDAKGIQLANEWSPGGTWRQRAFIPRQMVVNVFEVKLTLRRGPRNGHADVSGVGTQNGTGGTTT